MKRNEFSESLKHNQPSARGAYNTNQDRSKSHFKNQEHGRSQQRYANPNNYLPQEDNEQFNLEPILNAGETFPEDLLLLLTEQGSNIKNFKAKIEKEKLKVLNDMDIFKKQIIHIIEDLKISMMAELDLSYKTYIQKYAYLKSEVQEVRMLRKQIEAQNIQPQLRKYNTNSSNSDMVKQIQKQVHNLRNYKISQYISELQRKKLSPLMELSQQLIIMTSSPFQFYDAATTSTHLGELRSNFSHFTKHMFQSLKIFIRSPETLFQQGEVGMEEKFQEDGGHDTLNYSNNDSNWVDKYPQSDRMKHFEDPYRQFKSYPQQKYLGISPSLQSVKFSSIQRVKLSHTADLKPQTKVELLCAVLIKDKYVVSGGRDGVLNVMALGGRTIKRLTGHKSAICTLAIINDRGRTILASGGDYGCSSIFLWDTISWEIIGRLQHHSTAVTSILDLGDSQTMLSGSYDKKINVYNYQTPALQFSLPNNKSSVFALLANLSKTKLIVGIIDTNTNGVSVWSIKYAQNRTVQTFTLDRLIQNNSVICSLASSFLRPDLIVAGTKNGKVKLWNIDSGECEGEFSVGNVPVVDLVLLERQNKQDYPLVISCGIREISLVLTDTESRRMEQLDVGTNLHIQFGCGIGPKMILGHRENSEQLYIVNQSKDDPQISVYSLI